MGIELDNKVTRKVVAKTIRVHAKVRDCGSYTIKADDGTVLLDADGCYVPNEIIPGDYGDYIDIEIDLETGQITNWEKPSARAIQDFVRENSKGEEDE